MNIAFEDKALEELYLKGKTSTKRNEDGIVVNALLEEISKHYEVRMGLHDVETITNTTNRPTL